MIISVFRWSETSPGVAALIVLGAVSLLVPLTITAGLLGLQTLALQTLIQVVYPV